MKSAPCPEYKRKQMKNMRSHFCLFLFLDTKWLFHSLLNLFTFSYKKIPATREFVSCGRYFCYSLCSLVKIDVYHQFDLQIKLSFYNVCSLWAAV
ncbi:hypothetical protein DVX06_10340 [Enterococcus faecium]|nr:hypothetical protein [Enterococcus faecium]TKN75389.1 hypothetical protein DVX06_10340 [Enterococcus faecium]